jgi:sugar/nucleoside kinase (ribokinase family)
MKMSTLRHQGLFVGLVTLDLIYRVEALPDINQKIVALDYTVAAGGPATNASVAFNYLGNRARLTGVVGNHPITGLIQGDLEQYAVEVIDLDSTQIEPPPTSSILVTQATGERAVISLNALRHQAEVDTLPASILQGIDIVLIDGHQLTVGAKVAQWAKKDGIPVVMDGGSWKPGLELILPWVDYAICSANFYPPGCSVSAEVFEYLGNLGISHIAITHGGDPIEWSQSGRCGTVAVSPSQVVDTLGAGDIFHGAFCHYILQETFMDALAHAAAIATRSCQSFGTRQWMHTNGNDCQRSNF